jgi:hypothetical protein
VRAAPFLVRVVERFAALLLFAGAALDLREDELPLPFAGAALVLRGEDAVPLVALVVFLVAAMFKLPFL